MTIFASPIQFPGQRAWRRPALPTLEGVRARLARPALFGRDLLIVLGVMAAYFVLRGQAPDRLEASVALTEVLVSIERHLGLFWEPAIQDASIRYHWSRELANFTYAYLHFPVLGAVAIWLWLRDRTGFVFLRNVMFVSMVIGLVFYYALPAAPPRLMALHGHDLGFTDTVFGGNTSVSYAQPGLITNEYAAIPSFHFGWILLASLAIWLHARNIAARTVAVVLTVLMTWAIVASANHLFIDMALGGAVIGAAWWVAARLARREAEPRTQEMPVAITKVRMWLEPIAA